MKNEYLLSIVVPTKNRYKYLKHLILLIKGFKSDDIELVIQDNTEDNKEIVDYITNYGFEHLKYFHTTHNLSVSQNSDLAILNSNGKYVCFIGDDDGVTPQILSVVDRMENQGYESVICTPTIYNWPDFYDTSIFDLTAAISYKKYSHSISEIIPKDALLNVIKSGFKSLGMMPRVYQGIVRRDVLDMVFKNVDTYFPGASPDMANAVALSLFVKKHYYFDSPIIISGQCKTVGGGERLNKELLIPDQVKFLPKDIKDKWNKKLPYYWCAQTIFPQSGLSALDKLGFKYNKLVDYDDMLSYFISKHPLYKKDAIILSNNRHKVILKYWWYFYKRIYSFFYNRIYYYLTRKTKLDGFVIKRDIIDIEQCIEYLLKL